MERRKRVRDGVEEEREDGWCRSKGARLDWM